MTCARSPFLAAALAALASTSPALAATPERPEQPGGSAFHADFEVDPTAYVLDGYSLHVGLGWSRLRLDVGAFAMALPRFVHGNDAFDVAFDGYGAKLQYFPFAEQKGAFFGVDSGVSRALVRRKGTALASRDTQVSVGVNAGYRLDLGAGFHATPWLGVSHSFGARDVTLGGKTFERNPWIVFPAIHVGYRFR